MTTEDNIVRLNVLLDSIRKVKSFVLNERNSIRNNELCSNGFNANKLTYKYVLVLEKFDHNMLDVVENEILGEISSLRGIRGLAMTLHENPETQS